MSGVYLEKLKIKGFRSYKSETDLTFSAGPGLTVIVGPNGLGKSTLFDAIEWGLTGELRRLNGMDAKVAEKKAALGEKPEVQLWFSDSAHVYRSLTMGTIKNVGATKIEDWLTAEQWRGVSSIADCLQLTHFLGQSSRQMFVHLDGKQRWGLLEGPAGLQSLWKVQSTLGRKQTDIGFDRVREGFAREQAKLEEELSFIEGLQEQLRSKRELERADDILAPEEILARGRSISEELIAELRAVAPSQPDSDISGNDVDGFLQRMRMNLELAQQNLANQRAQLAQWPNLARNYADTIVKQASLSQEKDLATREFEAADAKVSMVIIQATAIRAKHQLLVDENSAQQTARNTIVSEIERMRQISAADVRLETARQISISLAKKHSELTQLLATNRALLEAVELQRSRQTALTEQVTSLKASLTKAERLLNENATRRVARLELVSLPSSLSTLATSINDERQVLARLEADEKSLNLEKDAALAVSNAIAAGVAQIASVLREEDCVCPVCQTTFTATGRLKELAARQANEADQRLAGIEERISQQAEKIQTTKQKLFDLNANVIQLKQRHKDLTTLVLEADRLESTLRGIPLLSDLEIEEFIPTLTTSLEKNQDAAKALIASIALNPEASAVRADIQWLSNLQIEMTSEQEKTAAAIADLERELKQLRNIASSGKTEEQLQAAVLEHDSALIRSSESLLESQEKLDEVNGSEAVLKAALAAKKKLVAEIEEKISAQLQYEKELAERWTRQGYTGLPMPLTVQRIDESHSDSDIRLQRILQEHSTLLEGRRRYLAHVDLQRIEASLEALCEKNEVKDIDGAILKINAELAALKKQQDSLSDIQQKRTYLLSQLTQKAEDIRNSVSKPLNLNTEKFCAALMSDRNYPVNLNAVASATTAQALLSFQPDESGKAKNPLLYMSEGQLAATSLCLLFGASATYPWSRWKGLLMDDPLHHNDSIHAAAFIDVVRNLISSRDYQIIVSTHDMEQAGYFLRKCRNAGINARYLHLYGRAEDGTALVHSA
ncbi:AAA family ATPase [Alcaligenes sp. DN25]|uniref:AAA family ATPase n=1 Tax=Alcaligenes TaxID=507 RepID=UPI002030F6FD|nr:MULTISPECIES: SMC family ATPase [Alcaligenes]URW82164.1 AAA family ATPase [Alcaligenes sp. DN25]WEA66985.1 SMC family ATPase [Alcaligenes faecalis]